MHTSQNQGLESYKAKKDHLVIGLMSGTSLDGVDAALVAIETDAQHQITNVSLKGFHYVPYSDEIRKRLMALCSVETSRIDDLVIAHYGLSEWYAFTVKQLMELTGASLDQVDAISTHGQTVWHVAGVETFPGPEGPLPVRASLQIGELSTLAERTGLPVVGNFHARDLAAGGVGTPLVPYGDKIIFGHPEKGRLLQNIGGISNVTVIPAGASFDQVFAFDIGPGNMVMDELVQISTGGAKRYDEGGQIAATGQVSQPLLDIFLADPFYQMKPPKGTGREVYGKAFVAKFKANADKLALSFEDTLATATALTATTITNAYKQFVFPVAHVQEVIVSGGGAHNQTLLNMIKQGLPDGFEVTTTAKYGIPDDAKEAVAYAILGHETLMGRPSNVPSVTGAPKPVILGNLSW
ncbi:anhydro-N-acetylmuramic acid kinase [Paenibacillus frigoriresistens]|uniref:anhydro-N-acetylmuramic acid kinase n=1 Tax=Paenibacillus alginolyticus TaxID=59839 RepID=UPI001566EB6B|nr:anhydro-N-acetylmuramic acid kinase [Paenibacillus frigoriresistens]NRF94414.1 anhydro-N-acetylmuramic acid kinase [Paenibacillus frigoriresistens]